MTTPVPLLRDQPATVTGQMPSRELVEVIQRLVAAVREIYGR